MQLISTFLARSVPRILELLLAIALLGESTLGHAQFGCVQSQFTVFYGNGINASIDDAIRDMTRLSRHVGAMTPSGRYNIEYQLSYALSGNGVDKNFVRDLLESYVLRVNEPSSQAGPISWSGFVKFAFSLAVESPGDLALPMDPFRYNYSDANLDRMVARYKRAIDAGKRVIVVAHSQGNLYANAAYDRLWDWYKVSGPRLLAGPLPFNIVSVATPASFIAGVGTQDIDKRYITSQNDRYMNWVRIMYPNTLPAYANLPTDLDTDGHAFGDVYLAYASERIRTIVWEAMKNSPPTCFENLAVQISGPGEVRRPDGNLLCNFVSTHSFPASLVLPTSSGSSAALAWGDTTVSWSGGCSFFNSLTPQHFAIPGLGPVPYGSYDVQTINVGANGQPGTNRVVHSAFLTQDRSSVEVTSTVVDFNAGDIHPDGAYPSLVTVTGTYLLSAPPVQ